MRKKRGGDTALSRQPNQVALCGGVMRAAAQRPWRLRCLVLVWIGSLCGEAIADTMITNLGTLGGNRSEAVAVNDNGQVVGTSFTAADKSHAFSWTSAGGMVDLSLGGAFGSRPTAIANSGQVIGYDYYTAFLFRAFSWTATGGIVEIGNGTSTQVHLAAVNESGQVAGYFCTDTLQQNCRAFIWTAAGGMVNLGALLGDAPSFVTDMNSSGQVVGYWEGPSDYQAFSWTVAGGMVELGTLAGRIASFAAAVSDSGHVVGYSGNPGPASAYVDRRAFSWAAGDGMTDLGTLGGNDSEARYVNSNGQVVGTSRLAGLNGESHAFSWMAADGMVDLGDLGGDDSYPLGLSDSGVVMGFATGGGGSWQHGFSWTAGEGMSALTLGGAPPICGGCSYPRGISPGGEIVGFSYTATGKYHAFSWTEARGIRDLGTLGGGVGNATYSDAVAVNNHGYVVGWAYTAGVPSNPEQRAVLWQSAFALNLPDVNANGVSDIALVRDWPIRAEIRDGLAGAWLSSIHFLGDAYTPHAIAPLPDSDGNGVAELALLATRNSDRRLVVEIRNVSGAAVPRKIWYAPDSRPVAMSVIAGDADNNGIAEIAVLSTRKSDGRGRVEVKNAFGATSTTTIWASSGLTLLDLEVVEDADANGMPEVAILATRNSDGRTKVEIADVSGVLNRNSIYFMLGTTPVEMTVVHDAVNNSVPEVAVVSTRDADGRAVVEIKSAAGTTNPVTRWISTGHTALAIEPVMDADGNSVAEVAVLSTRDSDGRIAVSVMNAFGAAELNRVWYPSGFTGRSLAILSDLDENGVPEAAVLLNRDGDGRIVIGSRNASGSPTGVNYWFFP